jgi:hypothetical protein
MSARHLLSGWQNEDPGLRMVAEVITSGFASGFSWGGHADGKRVCCALPRESPKMAGEPYGAARVGRSARRYRAARNEVTMPSSCIDCNFAKLLQTGARTVDIGLKCGNVFGLTTLHEHSRKTGDNGVS